MYMFLNLIFVWFSFFLPYKFTPTIKKRSYHSRIWAGNMSQKDWSLINIYTFTWDHAGWFWPTFLTIFFSVSPAYSLICSHQLQIISFQSFLLLSASSSVESVFTCLRRAFLPLLLPVSENWSYIQQYADDNLCGAQHKREHEHERARRDRGRVGVCSNNTVLY